MGFEPIIHHGTAASGNYGATNYGTWEAPYSKFVASDRNFYTNWNPSNATQCTWWVYSRAKHCNIYDFGGYPNAVDWQYFNVPKSYNMTNLSAGDVIVFGAHSSTGQPGHVAFVEHVSSYGLTISEAANSTNHPWWLGVFVFNWSDFNRMTNNGTKHWHWGEDVFACVLKVGGGGSGGEIDEVPVDKPEKPPEGKDPESGEWVEVWTKGYETLDTGSTYLTGRYECAPNSRAGDSGTQDEPKAPKWWGSASTRTNFRWNPLTCYTEERTMIYDSKKERVWSAWEEVAAADNYVPENQIDVPYWWDGWLKDWEDGG